MPEQPIACLLLEHDRTAQDRALDTLAFHPVQLCHCLG